MKTKFWVLLTALLSVTLVNYHCRKQDERYTNAVEEKDQSALVHEFLHTNAGTDPLVRSVATEIERREKLHQFVYEFARVNGLPVWNKAIVTLPSIKNVQQNASGAGGDSLVYIPLVIPDAVHTNGFIRAVINDSISLSYCLAKDYKNYSFSSSSPVTSADEFASLLMMMDKNVFGIKDFTITDQRLLLVPGQTVSAGISRSARITDVVSGTGNNLCEGTLFTVSWLVQDAANCTCANGASNGGVCHDWFNGCADCSNTVTISINVGASGCGGAGGEGPVGGGIPIGGGPSGGGTGSGGGQIPPYYPCVGTVAIPLLQEPLPPCPPPSGGTGWTPSPSIAFFGIESITSNFTNPCIVAAKNKLPEFNLNIFANSLYFAPLSQTFKWKIIFEENRTLVYQDGSPKPAESFAVTPNKEWHVVLNPVFWEQPTQPNATQEIAGLNILHEIVHGFIRVYKDFYNLTQLNSFNTHEIMFKDCINAMALVLKNSFGLSDTDAKGLALQGLDDVLEKEYSATGTLSTYNTQYNTFAISNYGISITQAEDIFDQFLSGIKGTRCF